jgi:DNA-binding MarR family transcriptional regulator
MRDADMPAFDRLGEVLDFMRLLWAVDHALQRSSKRMEKTLGVTGRQRLVIRIVGKFPGIAAGHLARILHLHPSSLTGILERLEKKGLIRRRSDPRDGRRSLLGLTRRGRSFDVEAGGTIEAAIQRVLARTPRDKLESTQGVLERIAASLESPSARSPRISRGN